MPTTSVLGSATERGSPAMEARLDPSQRLHPYRWFGLALAIPALQKGRWICHCAAAILTGRTPHLEVKVTCGRAPRRANQAKLLPRLNPVASSNARAAEHVHVYVVIGPPRALDDDVVAGTGRLVVHIPHDSPSAATTGLPHLASRSCP